MNKKVFILATALVVIIAAIPGSNLYAQTKNRTLEGGYKVLTNVEMAVSRSMDIKDAIRCSKTSIYNKANILEFIELAKDASFIARARDYMSKARIIIDNCIHLTAKDIEELNRAFSSAELELKWRSTRKFLKQVNEAGYCYIDPKTLEGTGPISVEEINNALYMVLYYVMSNDAKIDKDNILLVFGSAKENFENGLLYLSEKFGGENLPSLNSIRAVILGANTVVPYNGDDECPIEDMMLAQPVLADILVGTGDKMLTAIDIQKYCSSEQSKVCALENLEKISKLRLIEK